MSNDFLMTLFSEIGESIIALLKIAQNQCEIGPKWLITELVDTDLIKKYDYTSDC